MKKIDRQNWLCEKCKRVVSYTKIEANFDLGKHTEEHPIRATFPYMHKNCGGIVHPISLNEINE